MQLNWAITTDSQTFFFQQQEKKLVAEIKRTAKTGNEVLLLYYIQFQVIIFLCRPYSMVFLLLPQAATKILARQLIRLRQQISNLQGSRAQIRGIATHTQVKFSFFCFIQCWLSGYFYFDFVANRVLRQCMPTLQWLLVYKVRAKQWELWIR
jgi:hypothetical protein